MAKKGACLSSLPQTKAYHRTAQMRFPFSAFVVLALVTPGCSANNEDEAKTRQAGEVSSEVLSVTLEAASEPKRTPTLPEIARSAIAQDIAVYYSQTGQPIEASCIDLLPDQSSKAMPGTAYFTIRFDRIACPKLDAFDPTSTFESVSAEGDGTIRFAWEGRSGGSETIAVRKVDPRQPPFVRLREESRRAARTHRQADEALSEDATMAAEMAADAAAVQATLDAAEEPAAIRQEISVIDDLIEFRTPKAEITAHNFLIPCPNKRRVPLIDVLRRGARQGYTPDKSYLLTVVDSRGDEVRVLHQIRGYNGFRGPLHPVIVINSWGDLTPYDISMDAVMVSCYL